MAPQRPDERHQLCPTCNGTGVVERTPRDTLRMRKVEFDALLIESTPTPAPAEEETRYMEVPEGRALIPPKVPVMRPDLQETLADSVWMKKRVDKIHRVNVWLVVGSLVGLMGILVMVVVFLLHRR